MTGMIFPFEIPPVEEKLELTREEAQVLYDFLKHHYIDYENIKAHEVINKVSRFVHSGKVNVICR